MGTQLSDCRCNNESKSTSEMNLAKVIKKSSTLGVEAPPIPVEEPSPEPFQPSHTPPEQMIEQKSSKQITRKETSNSGDNFQNQMQPSLFSREVQGIIHSMDMSVPEKYLQIEEVRTILEEASSFLFANNDSRLYYGGFLNQKYHGLG